MSSLNVDNEIYCDRGGFDFSIGRIHSRLRTTVEFVLKFLIGYSLGMTEVNPPSSITLDIGGHTIDTSDASNDR